MANVNDKQYPAQDRNGHGIVVNANGFITTDSLDVSKPILINGKIDFSHITSKYEGQALVRENARRTQNGMRAVDKPFTNLSLKNAQVQAEDPNNLTVNEYYGRDSLLYTSKKNPEKGLCLNAISKSRDLPRVYQRDPQNPNQVTEIFPEGELATDLNVTAVFRVFKPKEVGKHAGLSLDAVICNEPCRTATFGGNAATLQGCGFNVVSASDADRTAYQQRMAAQAAQAQQAAAQAAAQPMNTAPNTYGQAPAQTGYAQPGYAQPTYAPAGAPAPAPVAGYAPAGAPAPAPVAAPVAAPTAPAPTVPGQVTDPNIPQNGYGGISLG